MQRRGVGRCFGARSRKRSSGFDQTQACSVCLLRQATLTICVAARRRSSTFRSAHSSYPRAYRRAPLTKGGSSPRDCFHPRMAWIYGVDQGRQLPAAEICRGRMGPVAGERHGWRDRGCRDVLCRPRNWTHLAIPQEAGCCGCRRPALPRVPGGSRLRRRSARRPLPSAGRRRPDGGGVAEGARAK